MNHNAECMNCGGPLTTSGSCPGCDSPKPVYTKCGGLPGCGLSSYQPNRNPQLETAVAILAVLFLGVLAALLMVCKECRELREDRDNAVSELNAIRTEGIWDGTRTL